jgi:hypothetical protein
MGRDPVPVSWGGSRRNSTIGKLRAPFKMKSKRRTLEIGIRDILFIFIQIWITMVVLNAELILKSIMLKLKRLYL